MFEIEIKFINQLYNAVLRQDFVPAQQKITNLLWLKSLGTLQNWLNRIDWSACPIEIIWESCTPKALQNNKEA